MIYLQRPRV